MISKVKDLLSSNKGKVAAGTSAIMLAVPGVIPFADGSQSAEVKTALQAVASDITSTITGIAPVALGIVGIFLTWKYGMRFFKSISK